MMEKTGRYLFQAEPFHCDFSHRLLLGHLGNHLLNAADFHSHDRGFGMNYLNPIHKTWVLSRLAIEVEEMPEQYSSFYVETWVESAMRFFTNRNFRIVGEEQRDEQGKVIADGRVYGYGRSVWAMIDTDSRQPCDIFKIREGEILNWIESDKDCPIDKGSRVKMKDEAPVVRTIDTYYNDVDVNGHINSVKYIEHVLDLFSLDWYRKYAIRRFEIAYVAESHFGDRLSFSIEKADGTPLCCIPNDVDEDRLEYHIRISNGIEVCRSSVVFVKR